MEDVAFGFFVGMVVVGAGLASLAMAVRKAARSIVGAARQLEEQVAHGFDCVGEAVRGVHERERG